MEDPINVDLLRRYNNGTATDDEIAIVESWFIDFPLDERPVLGEEETQADLADIRLKLMAISGKPGTGKWNYWIAAAAVVLMCLSIGLYLHQHTDPSMSVSQLAAHDIQAGKNTATLTLANGSKIILTENSKGKLADQSGVTIDKNPDGRIVYHTKIDETINLDQNTLVYNTLSTAKGEQYRVDLPDGTKVWLNAASSLKYAPSFAGLPERKVQLSGEAYFEVAKDKTHPFIVETQTQKVTVLGTHFNINCYTDEPDVKTTLLEGSVNINDRTVLKPGQQSVVSNTGNIHVTEADLRVAIAWKEGEFVFKEAPLQTIMRQIARWYNLDIIYQGVLTDDTFNGVIDRKANLSRILKILERGGVRFKVQGKKLIVIP